MRIIFGWVVSVFLLGTIHVHAADLNTLLDSSINGNHRSAANKARDTYRHPKETLTFFGLTPEKTVVEIWPSAGWYTEILAPVMREEGTLYAAGFGVTANRTPEWRKKATAELQNKFVSAPDIYERVIVTELSIPERPIIAPANSADLVLTFRNVHNWMKGEYADGVFRAMFRALKPGGHLGVVEHRAPENMSLDEMILSGYVTEKKVKALAADAGFTFVKSSEINANPNDSKDHPRGVWTLPPSLRLREQDKEKYLAIGESDRMTLLFTKP